MSRFWAWSAYVPFSLAVSLVFFGHCDGDTVLTVLLLSTIPFHLLLNAIELSLAPRADVLASVSPAVPGDLPGRPGASQTVPRAVQVAPGELPLQVPQSKILQLLIGTFCGGMLVRMMMEFRRSSTISDHVGNFFTDLVMPWMIGSFASQIPLVAFGSLLAGVGFVIGVTPVKWWSAPLAKLSLLTLLVLSLFTIWVSSSDLSTAKEVAAFTVETFAKRLIGLPIDAAISVVWIVGLFWAFSAINRERARYSTSRTFDSNLPPLWVKLVCPVLGWMSLVGAVVIDIYRM